MTSNRLISDSPPPPQRCTPACTWIWISAVPCCLPRSIVLCSWPRNEERVELRPTECLVVTRNKIKEWKSTTQRNYLKQRKRMQTLEQDPACSSLVLCEQLYIWETSFSFTLTLWASTLLTTSRALASCRGWKNQVGAFIARILEDHCHFAFLSPRDAPGTSVVSSTGSGSLGWSEGLCCFSLGFENKDFFF